MAQGNAAEKSHRISAVTRKTLERRKTLYLL